MKFYETPAVEVVEMEVAQFLCASGDDDSAFPPTVDVPGDF